MGPPLLDPLPREAPRSRRRPLDGDAAPFPSRCSARTESSRAFQPHDLLSRGTQSDGAAAQWVADNLPSLRSSGGPLGTRIPGRGSARERSFSFPGSDDDSGHSVACTESRVITRTGLPGCDDSDHWFGSGPKPRHCDVHPGLELRIERRRLHPGPLGQGRRPTLHAAESGDEGVVPDVVGEGPL
jgi:hypothetical protein